MSTCNIPEVKLGGKPFDPDREVSGQARLKMVPIICNAHGILGVYHRSFEIACIYIGDLLVSISEIAG